MEVKKLSGRSYWAKPEDAPGSVVMILKPPDQLRLDVVYEERRYEFDMIKVGKLYKGTCKKTGTIATCRVVESDDGVALLFGNWREGTDIYPSWWAELEQEE